jgi:branched-chain amino acid transport system permease protein
LPEHSANRVDTSRRPRLLNEALGVLVPVVGFSLALHVDNNELLLVYMMGYVAMAQGINVIYGFTGYLPFGYFGLFGAGAYAFGIGVTHLHWPAFADLALGGVGAVAIGVVLIPLFRLRGAYFAIATLAAALALGDIVANPALTSLTNGPDGLNLGSVYNSGEFYVSSVVLVAVSLLAVVWLRNSRFGLSLRAIRDDPYAASMMGINVPLRRAVAWLIAAALAGFAGALYAWATSFFYPTAVFDVTITVLALVFALFGGVGTLWGPTLGAIVLYSLYDIVGVTDPQAFQLIYGLAIAMLVLFAPRGLAGIAAGIRNLWLRRQGREVNRATA